MRRIIAIKANTTPTRYVQTTDNRADKKIVATLTDKKNDAHDFVTMENALGIIDRLVNHHNRIFTAVEMNVVQPKRFHHSNAELS